MRTFPVICAESPEWWYEEMISVECVSGSRDNISHVIDWGRPPSRIARDEKERIEQENLLKFTLAISHPKPNRSIVIAFDKPCRISGEPCSNHLKYEPSVFPVHGRGWHCTKCNRDQSQISNWGKN